MKKVFVDETLESFKDKYRLEKVYLFNNDCQALSESKSLISLVTNKKKLADKITHILKLTKDSEVVNNEILICMESYKVVFNFFENGSIVIVCNDDVNLTILKERTDFLIKDIEPELLETADTVNEEYQTSSTIDKLNIKARTSTFERKDNPLLISLKKITMEYEGPLGTVIFKKNLRLTGISSEYIDKNLASNLVSQISESMSQQNQEEFLQKARHACYEYFGE